MTSVVLQGSIVWNPSWALGRLAAQGLDHLLANWIFEINSLDYYIEFPALPLPHSPLKRDIPLSCGRNPDTYDSNRTWILRAINSRLSNLRACWLIPSPRHLCTNLFELLQRNFPRNPHDRIYALFHVAGCKYKFSKTIYVDRLPIEMVCFDAAA